MEITPATQLVTAIDDTRTAPLEQTQPTAALLRRLRPGKTPGSDRVAVAAFNASL